ncbi:hypothetical protein FB446DRAFT_701093 [Lentinula raphanica]|nr:hypothetical protein FB446DRAFT_701093 [Lentinula raphanica]
MVQPSEKCVRARSPPIKAVQFSLEWLKYENKCIHIYSFFHDPESATDSSSLRDMDDVRRQAVSLEQSGYWDVYSTKGAEMDSQGVLFGGSEDAFVQEISFIDPWTQNATITSENLSLSQFATCLEQIRYSPSSTPSRTVSLQTAEIQAQIAQQIVWKSDWLSGSNKTLKYRGFHRRPTTVIGRTRATAGCSCMSEGGLQRPVAVSLVLLIQEEVDMGKEEELEEGGR